MKMPAPKVRAFSVRSCRTRGDSERYTDLDAVGRRRRISGERPQASNVLRCITNDLVGQVLAVQGHEPLVAAMGVGNERVNRRE